MRSQKGRLEEASDFVWKVSEQRAKCEKSTRGRDSGEKKDGIKSSGILSRHSSEKRKD